MGYVLTWVWQGGLVALVLAAVLRAAPALRLSAAQRYAFCWLGLGVVLVLPLVPAALEALPYTTPTAGALAPASGSGTLTLPGAPPALVMGLVALWALTVAGGLVRLALDLRNLLLMKRRARPMPESEQRRLPLWQRARNRGRRVQLAVLDDLVPAAVLGFRRPLIVVPRALRDALTDAELDQVVAHEHAHVERCDDWASLVQRIVGVPFGWHPAVWLIGRWLRRERELAADERVALRTGAPRAYARCLARVAEAMSWPPAPRLASGAVGSRGEVARRVAHLLDARWLRAHRSSRSVLGAAGVLATVLALLIGGRLPSVELGVGGAAATQVRVAPPPSPALHLRAQIAPEVMAGGTGPGRPRRVAGVGLPARPAATAPLAAIRLVDFPAPQLHPAARSSGLESRGRSRAPLAAHDLGLSAHVALVAPTEPMESFGESRWAWAGRAGTSLGSWFAGAGRTTAGAFRGLGSSITRTFTGRR